MWTDLSPNSRGTRGSFDQPTVPRLFLLFFHVQHGNPGIERYPIFYWTMEILGAWSKHLESKIELKVWRTCCVCTKKPHNRCPCGKSWNGRRRWHCHPWAMKPSRFESVSCLWQMARLWVLCSSTVMRCAKWRIFDGCNSGVHASTGCQLWSSSIVLARHLMARLGFRSWTTNVRMQVNCDIVLSFHSNAFDAWH